jgi:hypothetical protein
LCNYGRRPGGGKIVEKGNVGVGVALWVCSKRELKLCYVVRIELVRGRNFRWHEGMRGEGKGGRYK